MEMNEVENTPLEKEEQGRTTLGGTPIEKKKELDKNLVR